MRDPREPRCGSRSLLRIRRLAGARSIDGRLGKMGDQVRRDRRRRRQPLHRLGGSAERRRPPKVIVALITRVPALLFFVCNCRRHSIHSTNRGPPPRRQRERERERENQFFVHVAEKRGEEKRRWLSLIGTRYVYGCNPAGASHRMVSRQSITRTHARSQLHTYTHTHPHTLNRHVRSPRIRQKVHRRGIPP